MEEERIENLSFEIQEALKTLVTGVPDAFFVLAGSMRYDPASGQYVTGSFDTYDENSVRSLGMALPSGGRDRVLAAATMHQVFPEAYIVALSKTRDAHKPTYASVTQKELLEQGVPKDRIMLDEASIDTVTELKEAARVSMQHGWRTIALIVSAWQVPRAQALLNHIESFSDGKEEEQLLASFANSVKNQALAVQFLDTTSVLSTRSTVYKQFFEKTLAKNSGMQARIAAEAESLRQIEQGMYGGRALTHAIWKDAL